MSLQVAVAHTGQRLDADPLSFNSLDGLKAWISSATQIPPQDQILLTPKGRHVKLQALLTENEIFVYDREVFNLSASQSDVPETPLPELYVADDPPDTLSSHTDLKAWQSLFQARRDWALEVLAQSESMSKIAAVNFSDQATIEKATQVAVGNHDTHIQSLEKKQREASSWFDDVSKETGENLRNLDKDFGQLASIPAKPEFAQFIAKGIRTGQNPQKASPGRMVTLQEYLDTESVRKAMAVSKRVRESFGQRIANMGTDIEKITAEYNELLGAVDQSQSRSLVDDSEEPGRLYNEVLAVTKKVDSDYQHVMSLEAVSRSVAQVSKMALLHTRNFLPAIKEYSAEMSDLVRRSVEQKNHSVKNFFGSMRTISNIESVISSLNAELDSLDIPKDGLDAFELISLVSRLPYVYGSLLVESVRRREWMDKMKKDTSTLAEEMAGFQEEEERRRKKWLKPIADVINTELVQSNMPGFEMNVHTEKDIWPEVTREDLYDHLKVLQSLEGQQASAETLIQAIKEIDRPTKQQIKRAKNFKMGSVHEPAFGQGSLILRGDEEVRVLKEANTKLEDELKGYKSRVRRLEDLLHRQSHAARLSIGSGFPSIGPQSPADPSTPTVEPGSPRFPPDEHSRRSSVSSRRFSSNQNNDMQALTRRILKLEAELAAEKDARAGLEREARAKEDVDGELRRQTEEAIANKKDIMDNMDAQQKEFADERRALKEEIANYKNKIEEAEDELDRILGSRDNERTGNDARLQELVSELEKVRKNSSEELAMAHDRIKELQSDLDQRKTSELRMHEGLAAVWPLLSSEELPEDRSVIADQLEELAQRSLDHLKDLERAVAMAQSENESLRSQAEKDHTELSSKVAELEAQASSLREQLDVEKAKSGSITAELEEERGHLRDLRTKFAEGETGSEALRQRVAEEEAKVGVLRMQLAESQSHANSLDVELMHLQKKMAKFEEVDSSRSHQRSVRAKELSQRLYTQHERLLQLMESLGFLVTFEDGAMVIQRASKVAGNSTMMTPDTNMGRSVTSPSPTPLRQQLQESIDLSFLQWSESGDPEEEDKRYTEFLNTLDRFNIDTFSESLLKRFRDMEHTARKWQREARAYREKAHRFHSESHEKIAFKSFKDGDLALFLPTRNQATRPWAAFNVGAPHYFLREQDAHRLHGREWLVARISKIEERVVDLSKNIDSNRQSLDGRSIRSEAAISFEDDNPFELSDGLRWYLLDASEEKPGAPSTPGLGKTTVASANVDAKGSIRMTKKSSSTDPAKTLGKSLDSRRSSGTSKKSVPAISNRNSLEAMNVRGGDNATGSGANSNTATRGASPADSRGPSHLHNESQSQSSGVERLLSGSGTEEGGVRLNDKFSGDQQDKFPSESPSKTKYISLAGPAVMAAAATTAGSSSRRPFFGRSNSATPSGSAAPANTNTNMSGSAFLRRDGSTTTPSNPAAPSTPRKSKSDLGPGAEGALVRAGSPAQSPSKRPSGGGLGGQRDQRPRMGIWDSLFQFDISYQSSKGKE